MSSLPSAARRTARPRLRRWTASALVALIVMLPVLLAFARIDAKPGRREIARVEQAVFAERAEISTPMQMFYGSMLPADAAARWAEHKEAITIRARVSGMLALFGISALVYVLLLLVRGRATAAVGCLTLCLLPSFSEYGHILRAEQCSSMFGLLGVVLIAGFPLMLQERRGALSAYLGMSVLMAVVGVTFGVARSCQIGAWIFLTVPAATLMMSVMIVAFILFPRAIRGVSPMFWPFRAAARRYVPWMLLVISSFTLTLLILQWGGGTAADSVSRVGLLPENVWSASLLLVVGAVGGLRMSLGVGLRLGRLRRVRPDAVLFLFVAALTMQHVLIPTGVDRMPHAVAFACLVADGVMTALVLGFGQLGKRRAMLRG